MNKLERRTHLLYWIKEYGLKTMVEVGTAQGLTAGYLLKNIDDKDFRIYCVDPYESYPELRDSTIAENLEKAQKDVFTDIRSTHLKKKSCEAVKEFEDESIDIVFIDANHQYEAIRQDVELWYPKVKVGGIFSGHDYSPKWNRGVKKAVDEFMTLRGLEFYTAKDCVWYMRKRN